MNTLAWERCDGYEYARAGSLEFFMIETDDGASLCRDGEAISPVNGDDYDSVDEAKAAAEETARAEYEALAEHFAPVLQWELFRVQSHHEHVATFNRYRLEAGEKGWWELLFLSKTGAVIERADHGRAADGPSARRAAEAALRELGVTFRTEERGPAPVIAMEDAVDSFVVGGAIGGACKATTRPDGEQKRRECSQCESAARADIAHICDGIMEARKAHADALAALRAFGEAISAVALVQFVSDVPVLR
jgi:hypothetical protein